MISRRSAAWMLVFIMWLPALADAAGPAAGPLNSLQQQVDQLTRQYDNLAARLTPPTLSHAVTCSAAFLATIRLDASGDQEIAYYAVQEQGGDPPANFVIFAEPGTATVSHEVDIEVGDTTRSFLLVAADTAGNVARTVVVVAPGLCDGS